jgi:hypothetical protein
MLTGCRNNRHAHAPFHQCNDVPNHLVVVLHVVPVRIQRPVGIEGDEGEALRGCVQLGDVQNVPDLGEVGRYIAASGEGGKLIVLLCPGKAFLEFMIRYTSCAGLQFSNIKDLQTSELGVPVSYHMRRAKLLYGQIEATRKSSRNIS